MLSNGTSSGNQVAVDCVIIMATMIAIAMIWYNIIEVKIKANNKADKEASKLIRLFYGAIILCIVMMILGIIGINNEIR